MWVWPQVQWATGMANDQRLFVTVSSPLGSLMASKNQAVGQMNFQTEVTGRTVRNTTVHYASKKYFYCLEVTAVTFQKVFTGCVLGTTTTSLEASGSLWTLASSTKALKSHRESWRKDRKSSTALWAVLRYLLCFQSHGFWWCYWKLWGDRCWEWQTYFRCFITLWIYSSPLYLVYLFKNVMLNLDFSCVKTHFSFNIFMWLTIFKISTKILSHEK